MTKSRRELKPGRWAECVEYNISRQLRRALAKYEEAVFTATGLTPEYVKAKTPFLEEETKYSPHRGPWNSESFVECPCCLHTMALSEMKNHTYAAGTSRKVNDIRGLEVFKQAGKKKIDCGEDVEADMSDAGTDYGDPSHDWSDSEDCEWDSWDLLNGHEQLINILCTFEKTGITKNDVNRMWWGEDESCPRV